MRYAVPFVARRIRAEETLSHLSSRPEDDDVFFEVAQVAFGEEAAQAVMYRRLKNRGNRG